MTERELQAQVDLMCKQLGLYHYHTWNSQRSAAGWPDSVIIGTRRAIFRELKTQAGQLSSAQREVGYRLTAAGLDWAVWRPADLMDGSIANELCTVAGTKLRHVG